MPRLAARRRKRKKKRRIARQASMIQMRKWNDSEVVAIKMMVILVDRIR
jgi:hypothetical protein